MKNALLLVLSAIWMPALQPVLAQPVNVTGTWVANDVPYGPWTVELKQDGAKITGSMQQVGGLRGPSDIYEGSLKGNAISFKANSPDGARVITFTGTVSGDEISLNRSTQVLKDVLSLNGLFGISAAPQFTIKRAAVSGATGGGQHWVASEGVAFQPWTFDLKIDDGTVNGSVGQAAADSASGTTTTATGPFAISDGKVSGNVIDFKVNSGGRIITFHGVRTGDQIAFKRSVQVVSGSPGMNGILGASGATEFTARLAAGGIAPAFAPKPAMARPAASPGPAGNVPVAANSKGPAGRWQATAVPNGPWAFEFMLNGSELTGNIRQAGGPSSQVSIAGGKGSETIISFKVLSPDAERVIAFNGRVTGNEISFVRQITPLPEGTRGGNDLYGGAAPLQFVANRIAAAPTLFSYKGFDVDVSTIQSLQTIERGAVLESLRRQIDIIDAAVTDPAQKAFLKTVPMVMGPSPGAPDNAAYGGAGSRRVVLQSLSYSPEKPVILHELMHAYHDQKLPNGFGNADILRLYQQAKSGGQFQDTSYMLSNPAEYFAMMSSVYLHGSAARDPSTRDNIKEKQPDCYQWLLKEFGPR
jgi:hypothetical protein